MLSFSSPQLPWILLWIGLAALIIGLLILTRTSWGQSQPLRKCAAMSLLVHLLLAAYATTIQIVTAGSPEGTAVHGPISVTLVGDSGQPPDAAESDRPANPWDKLLAGSGAAADVLGLTSADLARTELLAAPKDVEPAAPAKSAQPAKSLLEIVAAPVPPVQPSEAPSSTLHTGQAAKAAAPIDMPAPKPIEAPACQFEAGSDGAETAVRRADRECLPAARCRAGVAECEAAIHSCSARRVGSRSRSANRSQRRAAKIVSRRPLGDKFGAVKFRRQSQLKL